MTDEKTVNIPLLRKAVEWAEAEAAKPSEMREWEQDWWVLTPEKRQERLDLYGDDLSDREQRAYRKAPECGTTYCIAGFIAAQHGSTETGPLVAAIALQALDIQDEEDFDTCDRLFDGDNTIEDVRRIAEELAGERL